MNERIYLIGCALTGLLASTTMSPEVAAKKAVEHGDATVTELHKDDALATLVSNALAATEQAPAAAAEAAKAEPGANA